MPHEEEHQGRPAISRREWRNLIGFAVLVMAITTLPYLAGVAAQGPDWHFGGFLFGVDDGNSYLAKMRQGGVDGWLFHIVYTTEPHDGAFLFTPYLAAGKLAALAVSPANPNYVLAMLLVFHFFRIAFGLLLIVVTYHFIAYFVRKRSLRWLALILVCLGGGFGWLLSLVGLGSWLGSLPIDLILPEGYTFYLLYGLPHLSLARAAMLGGLLLTFQNLNALSIRLWLPRALLAGVLWLIMGLCVPFYIAVLYAVLGVWGLAALLRHRKFPFALFWRCVAGAVISLPLLIYNLVVFATNPIMRAWSSQNLLPSPHPLHYLFGYGLLVLLALPAFRWAWHRGRKKTPYLLILAWVIAGPVLAYLPIDVQRRFLEGIFVPLCILAVFGLCLWWTGLYRRYRRRLRLGWRMAVGLVVALTLPTTAIVLLGGIVATQWRNPANRLFHTSGENAALDWLNCHAPANSIVLSTIEVGNYVPARSSLLAFIGHGPETIHLPEKQAQTSQFLSASMPLAAQRDFLTQNRIHYIIFPGGQAAPLSRLYRQVFELDGFYLYEVTASQTDTTN